MRILIVEDEQALAEALAQLLRREGETVDIAADGPAGEALALQNAYAVIVLDIMLPEKDGLAVLRTLRAQGVHTPVLLLTALSDVADRVTGLDVGADDYLPKPFSTGELLARVRSLARRKRLYTGQTLAAGGLTLHREDSALGYGAARIRLSQREYQMMELLMQGGGQVIGRERFIEKIWGYDTDAALNTIEVYVSFLRKKLAALHADGIAIRTVRGVGYALQVEEETGGA